MFHALEDLIRQSQPRPGSYIPEDLLAAVPMGADVVLVQRQESGRAPTRPHQVVEVEGLPAIVEHGGRVLALMGRKQWAAASAHGTTWRRVPRPGETHGEAIPPKDTSYAKPRGYLRPSPAPSGGNTDI